MPTSPFTDVHKYTYMGVYFKLTVCGGVCGGGVCLCVCVWCWLCNVHNYVEVCGGTLCMYALCMVQYVCAHVYQV